MSDTTTTTRKPGRPTLYTNELAVRICDALEDGMTLIAIAEPPDMPSTTTTRRWMTEDANGEFRVMSARAREAGADAIMAEAQPLLDEATRENISVVRKQVSHLRWRASRLNPRRYGDRAQVEIGGGLAVTRKPSDDAPDWIREQLAKRAAAALVAAREKADEPGDDTVH